MAFIEFRTTTQRGCVHQRPEGNAGNEPVDVDRFGRSDGMQTKIRCRIRIGLNRVSISGGNEERPATLRVVKGMELFVGSFRVERGEFLELGQELR